MVYFVNDAISDIPRRFHDREFQLNLSRHTMISITAMSSWLQVGVFVLFLLLSFFP